MSKNDINDKPFDEGTLLKLDIFRECFREWFPVFVHNPSISHIFIYDMFAGSGKDSLGNPGSPLILVQEARGDNKQHCNSISGNPNKKVFFGFNEYDNNKRISLEAIIKEYQSTCQRSCSIVCPYQKSMFYQNLILKHCSLIKHLETSSLLPSMQNLYYWISMDSSKSLTMCFYSL